MGQAKDRLKGLALRTDDEKEMREEIEDLTISMRKCASIEERKDEKEEGAQKIRFNPMLSKVENALVNVVAIEGVGRKGEVSD